MHPSFSKRFSTLATLGLLLATALTVVWALAWPIGGASGDAGGIGNPATVPTQPKNDSVLSASRILGDEWDQKLRKWESSSAGPRSQPVQRESTNGVQLIGTILEPGNSYAMVVDRAGNIDLQTVGGVLQLEPVGLRVENITAREVVISFDGKTETLTLVQESQRTGGNLGTGSVDLSTESAAAGPIEPMSMDDELDWSNGSKIMEPVGSSSRQDARK